MDFLRRCAARLDAGEPASAVLADMRARYTTPRCLSVKTCLVRQMCAPTPEYVAARDALLAAEGEEEARQRLEAALAAGKSDDAETAAKLRTLPHRLPENAYALRVTRDEVRACKRLATSGTLRKNCMRRCVDGRGLLRDARALVAHPEAASSLLDLALALLLVTGRRTCEVLNLRSSFAEDDDGQKYAMRFDGQAKRRGTAEAYVVPLLAPLDDVVHALGVLRARQCGDVDATWCNDRVSRKYQSALRQRMKARGGAWATVGRVHDLRGVYACMALKLFAWPAEYSEALLAMSFLGHRGLHESLTYTPFFLGADFAEEAPLGEGRFTPPHFLAAEADGSDI
jgi:integrase